MTKVGGAEIGNMERKVQGTTNDNETTFMRVNGQYLRGENSVHFYLPQALGKKLVEFTIEEVLIVYAQHLRSVIHTLFDMQGSKFWIWQSMPLMSHNVLS